MGSLDGIQAGLRNLRRTRPLETMRIEVAPDLFVTAPTAEEMLRVKAYMVVQRNAVRDYLDVVALAHHLGSDEAISVLSGIDRYYDDRSRVAGSVLTGLVLALTKPEPRDDEITAELVNYRGLEPRWQQWSDVVAACQSLALGLVQA